MILADLLLVFAVSLAVSCALVLTKRWHGRFSMDHLEGVQKFHTQPTPRVGGVGIVAGMLAGLVLAPAELRALLAPLLLASLPALLVGLLEDITKKVGVGPRLLATMVSGALACVITGIALDRVGILLVNDLLAWWPMAVLFTAFAAAGVANAINIIDGFNGLSSGATLIALAALGTMAHYQGDTSVMLLCALTAAAVAGFWLVNFPLGKLFLGDGGAYFVGFTLAWISVLLLMRNPAVSPWAALMACGYPVIEVLYSMWRRKRSKQSTGAPDILHLHSLVKTQIILPRFPHGSSAVRNAAVSPIMWLYAALPATLAVWLEGASRLQLAVAFFACVLVYHLFYRWLAAKARLNPSLDSGMAALMSRPTPLDGQPKPTATVQPKH